jgi:hypothetical protein
MLGFISSFDHVCSKTINVYQGMEMLHMFLIDVIGRKSAAAKIFNSKIDEE